MTDDLKEKIWVLAGYDKETRIALRRDQITGLVEQGEPNVGKTMVLTETEDHLVSVPFDEALAGWLKVDVNPQPDNWQRFPDGSLKPFLTPYQYNELRDDDRFLYNCGPKPEGLV